MYFYEPVLCAYVLGAATGVGRVSSGHVGRSSFPALPGFFRREIIWGMRVSIIGLNHFNLRASRALLENLKAFYCDVLGLAQGERPSLGSAGYWLYAGSVCILHLSETAQDEDRPTHMATTFDHVAFTCTDRPQMEARLKRNNIAFRVATVPVLSITQLFLQDPAGNGVELSFKETDIPH